MLISWLLFSFGGCYLFHRLAIQSSYYADPERRLCGTLDKIFLNANSLLKKSHSFSAGRKLLPSPKEINPEDVKIYENVQQWWWIFCPPGNSAATFRFLYRRQKKLGLMGLPKNYFRKSDP